MSNPETAAPRQESTAKHTPGPWRFDKSGGILTRNNERLLVNGVAQPLGNHPRDAEATANARLIAAAPELLEALKAAQSFIARLCDISTLNAGKVTALPTYKQIQAAIAKAKGGQ